MENKASKLMKAGWKQCKFCRRKLPTKEWRDQTRNPLIPPDSFDKNDVIESSGYCTYCKNQDLK